MNRHNHIANTLNRYVRLCVFGLWLGAYVWLLVGGRFGTYLQPKLEFLVIGGTILLFLFLLCSWPRRSEHQHPQKDTWIKGGLLLLPLLYMIFVGDSALGSYALSKRPIQSISVIVADPDDLATAPSAKATDAVLSVEINTLLTYWRRYNGKRVAVKGLFSRDQRLPEGYALVYRFIIWCCAADAEPTGVLVHGPAIEGLADNDWVIAEGIFRVDMIDGQPSAFIEVSRVNRLSRPPAKDQYFYY